MDGTQEAAGAPAATPAATAEGRVPWGLARRAWAFVPLRALLLSLAAVLAIWGRFLSPTETLNPQATVPTVHNLCRAGGPELACLAPLVGSQTADAGAPGWQEGPADHFFRAAREEGRPRPSWNPYSGSGTPIALDAINVSTSLTRRFLSAFPGDQAHDVLILLRFLAWTFALVWAAGLLGVGTPGLGLLAVAAALAPYASSYVDINFLDVDLLAPWFLLLLAGLLTGKVRPWPAAALATALGAGVASLGFLQSQVVTCTAVGLLALLAAPFTRGRSLLLAAGFAVGQLLLLPSWLPLIGNLDQFISSRDLTCLVSRGQEIPYLRGSLMQPRPGEYASATFTLGGLALLLFAPRGWRFLGAWLVLLCLWLVFGLPAFTCKLPMVSGVRYVRHLVPHFQAAFLLLVPLAAWSAASLRPRLALLALAAAGAAAGAVVPGTAVEVRGLLLLLTAAGLALGVAALALRRVQPASPLPRPLLGCGLMLLALGPYLVGGNLVLPLRAGAGGGPEAAGLPLPRSAAGPLGVVRAISEQEDRRHLSPGGLLYPNWAAAIGVLDVFTIGAFYPIGFHELNAGLFPWWERDPQHVLNPDRFVPPPPQAITTIEFQRVLAANRVSLLTFHAGRSIFPPAPSPYARERCRPVAWSQESFVEAWACPDVGGVGSFPEVVLRAGSRPEALAVLQRASPAEIIGLAVLGPELDLSGPGPSVPTAAAGRVVSVDRRGDDLAYVLEVERGGVFAIADSWFRGWKATVNGQPAGLSRCNVAFKAVSVPAGRVTVALHFEVAR